ncbi:putative clathrin assembly protein At1g03050 [Musa acuminata AAA Group]|uniref:putative clathrin assembly protein At1g03050 n=1 Tax=Musa acuminata AAA Group TaxID=214697 RepID=UPI0031D6E415
MAPSRLRMALGAVKDQTSIGLAKVSNSTTMSELDVTIVKATRHNEFPAEEKHVREILSLTCYSRAYIGACVSLLSRRLGKTRSWAVALKTLILIHRLLSEGDPAYEQEIFFATRRGTRMLNMSDFRDTSRSDAWDFSAFVRTYALYLDERLDYRMHGRRKRRGSRSNIYKEEEEEKEKAAAASTSKATPVREMKTEQIFTRTQQLQQLLERFLACRPTGAAKHNRIVAVALYPLVKESFQIYLDLADIMSIFVDRFMELQVPDCIRVHDIFSRLSKQFDELEVFYGWSKSAGICRSSEYPEVERITTKKLDIMDEFIRDKAALTHTKRQRSLEADRDASDDAKPPEEEPEHNMNAVESSPEPEDDTEDTKEERAIAEVKTDVADAKQEEEEAEADLLNLKEDAMTSEENGDMLALALFDGNMADAAPKWEAFTNNDNSSDWETALVQTSSNLSGQKASFGGGFDMMLLDGMYNQAQAAVGHAHLGSGSGSSVVVHAPAPQPVLALPAPLEGGTTSGGRDPFAASLMVPPPSYVQMSEMERKQHLLVEEQQLWKQYSKDGMQGQLALAKLQQQFPPAAYPTGAYARMF